MPPQSAQSHFVEYFEQFLLNRESNTSSLGLLCLPINLSRPKSLTLARLESYLLSVKEQVQMNRSTFRSLPLVVLIAGVTLALAPSPARAALTVQLEGVIYTNNFGGEYKWNYSVTPTAGDGLNGAFFTVYDFRELITISSGLGGNWNTGNPLLGLTPAGLSPDDDPAIRNIAHEYDSSGELPATDQPLFFAVYSSIGTQVPGVYSWQDRVSAPDGAFQSGLGVVGVPGVPGVPGGPTNGAIPEPVTAGLAAMSLCALALAASRRRA